MTAKLCRLSSAFYAKYPNPPFDEILEKPTRAYFCIAFDCGRDYYICVPYRTNVTHKYAYKFKYSKRSQNYNSGLDYSKSVIIKKADKGIYLCSNAIVDKDEYVETFRNIDTIVDKVIKHVDDFVDHHLGKKVLHIKEYERRYSRSTLIYFCKELGINHSLLKDRFMQENSAEQ